MILRALQSSSVGTFLIVLTEVGGDPCIFCYRMGVGLLSADNGRFLAPVTVLAAVAKRTFALTKRNQVACSNLFSTFSAHFLTPKD
jgi:hypothetical protein